MKSTLIIVLILLVIAGAGVGGAYIGYELRGENKQLQVNLQDCPKPVQDMLAAETHGGQLGIITRHEEHGKTTYEVAADISGKLYDLKIAADGTLIVKKLEEDKKPKQPTTKR